MTLLFVLPFMLQVQAAPEQHVLRDLAPLVVESLRSYGKSMAARQATGPVHVDVESFQAAARALRESFDEQAFLAAIRDGTKKSGRDAALVCDNAGPGGRHQCFVAENGTYIAVDSVQRADTGVVVYATLTWTDRRRSGVLSLGSQSLRLTFRHSAEGWRLAKREVYRQT